MEFNHHKRQIDVLYNNNNKKTESLGSPNYTGLTKTWAEAHPQI
jgi:hypothetical protein